VRLQPFGPASAGATQAECLTRGVALLQALVDSWQGSGPEPGLACWLDLSWHGADGHPVPWPDDAAARALWLPRALWLTLYRISQEALTNVARHAQAQHAVLRLAFEGMPQAGAPLHIAWSVCDDGLGLAVGEAEGAADAVLPRGNGIVGIQQRVWALGADLHMGAAGPGAASPGWRLQADFSTRLLAPPVDTVTPEDH